MMHVLVTYDVATATPQGRRRLRNVAKACLDYGVRVQYSVFEMQVDAAQWTTCKQRLLDLMEPGEDSLRFYHMGSNWRHRVEHHGAKPALDVDGPLII